MIERLFGFRARPRRAALLRSVPDGSCIYAIGDIHGSLELLKALQRQIQSHANASPAQRKCVIYLGDYIDRGADSAAVLDWLIEQPLPGYEHVFLKGNHEDTLLRFLDGGRGASSWFTYGGDATVESYGVSPLRSFAGKDELSRVRAELHEKIPRSHRAFLARLKLHHTEGDYLFVHAGLRPGVALEAQSEEDLIWIREAFLRSPAEFGKLVVHGHSIRPEPDFQSNRIGIDTGAFASGRLTCLVLEGTKQSILAT